MDKMVIIQANEANRAALQNFKISREKKMTKSMNKNTRK